MIGSQKNTRVRLVRMSFYLNPRDNYKAAFSGGSAEFVRALLLPPSHVVHLSPSRRLAPCTKRGSILRRLAHFIQLLERSLAVKLTPKRPLPRFGTIKLQKKTRFTSVYACCRGCFLGVYYLFLIQKKTAQSSVFCKSEKVDVTGH